MTDLETFKRRVGYNFAAEQDTFTGNGTTVTFQLRHENVSEVQIYIDEEDQPAETYTVDATPGVVIFETAPEDTKVATIFYKFAAFTDDEANALITEYGQQKAVIEALRMILASQARLRNYKHGDTEVDNSQVFTQVRELIKMYEDELQQDESAEKAVIAVGKRKKTREAALSPVRNRISAGCMGSLKNYLDVGQQERDDLNFVLEDGAVSIEVYRRGSQGGVAGLTTPTADQEALRTITVRLDSLNGSPIGLSDDAIFDDDEQRWVSDAEVAELGIS